MKKKKTKSNMKVFKYWIAAGFVLSFGLFINFILDYYTKFQRAMKSDMNHDYSILELQYEIAYTDDAILLMDRIIKIGGTLLEPTLWNTSKYSTHVELNNSVIEVVSIPVKDHIPIQISKFKSFPCTSPRDLYHFLTSKEGFALIDPITPVIEHQRPPILTYKSVDENLSMEVVLAQLGLPWPIPNKVFVVGNVFDDVHLKFVSQSVDYIIPPISEQVFESEILKPIDPSTPRLYNTFGLQVSPGLTEDGKCEVNLFNTAIDLTLHPFLLYFINAHGFFTALRQRLYGKASRLFASS